MNYKTPALVLFVIVLISGCTDTQEAPATRGETNEATLACVSECQKALAEERDLSQGPCLSNEIIDNWVCDVAHAPRQQIDNDPINQCPAYGETTRHFVEVDPDCNFIRAV